jgi:hypothetical protein
VSLGTGMGMGVGMGSPTTTGTTSSHSYTSMYPPGQAGYQYPPYGQTSSGGTGNARRGEMDMVGGGGGGGGCCVVM